MEARTPGRDIDGAAGGAAEGRRKPYAADWNAFLAWCKGDGLAAPGASVRCCLSASPARRARSELVALRWRAPCGTDSAQQDHPVDLDRTGRRSGRDAVTAPVIRPPRLRRLVSVVVVLV
jgi:hypothetical protein